MENTEKKVKKKGRKKGEPTKTVTFRVNETSLLKAKNKYGRKLNNIINQYIKNI